jgi:hypothetical protein
MRPGSNAIEADNVSEKCTGLLIREDHPGVTQLGHGALFPSDKNLLDRFALFCKPAPGQFSMVVRIPSRYADGRQLHAIVDLSRGLGYSC